MLTGYYNFNRLRYIHRQLNESGMFRCVNQEMIPKTACFYGEKINFYIDTSDGVNEDLKINEYCGEKSYEYQLAFGTDSKLSS